MSSNLGVLHETVKVSGLYFDDGDIVLSAKRLGIDTIFLFKLHSKVLATHAKGLSVLTMPGGTNANEHYEGTPVVRMCEDASDLSAFLKLMYKPDAIIVERSMATTAAEAFPLLVLADKYVADDVERMLEYQISHDWPKTVLEFDAFENRALQIYRMHQRRGGGGGVGPWDLLVPEPASYVRFARIAKVADPQRVAGAFYQLSRMKLTNDWEKTRLEDGPREATTSQLAKMRRAMWSILSKDELARLQRGKERLARHVAQFVNELPGVGQLRPECARRWEVAATSLVQSDDILGDLGDFVGWLAEHTCQRCKYVVGQMVSAERNHIWSQLPEYFEIQPNERTCLDAVHVTDLEFVLK